MYCRDGADTPINAIRYHPYIFEHFNNNYYFYHNIREVFCGYHRYLTAIMASVMASVIIARACIG